MCFGVKMRKWKSVFRRKFSSLSISSHHDGWVGVCSNWVDLGLGCGRRTEMGSIMFVFLLCWLRQSLTRRWGGFITRNVILYDDLQQLALWFQCCWFAIVLVFIEFRRFLRLFSRSILDWDFDFYLRNVTKRKRRIRGEEETNLIDQSLGVKRK